MISGLSHDFFEQTYAHMYMCASANFVSRHTCEDCHSTTVHAREVQASQFTRVTSAETCQHNFCC